MTLKNSPEARYCFAVTVAMPLIRRPLLLIIEHHITAGLDDAFSKAIYHVRATEKEKAEIYKSVHSHRAG